MSELPSVLTMCEVYLAEIDNGLLGGFDVTLLPVPYAIRKHFEETNVPYEQMDFFEIVELVEKIQEEEAEKEILAPEVPEVNVLKRGLDSEDREDVVEPKKPKIQEAPCSRPPLEQIRKPKLTGWMEYWYGSGEVQEIKEEVEDLQYPKEEKKFLK